jgi:peptidoglycan hydrolase-like protein with peptidoglycan-binding domain
VGTNVALGDLLYSVNGHPVVALSGRLPAWRTITIGIDDGADVQQLEQSLVSLGYDTDSTVTIDGHFDAATTKMVNRWQAGLGAEQTGDVALGSVVFLATGATVTAQKTSIGAAVSDGSKILALSGTSQQVIIDVPEADRAAVLPGLAVDIDGIVGTVTLLRSAVESTVVVVQAVIAPSAPLDIADGTAVKVRVTLMNATGVLIVPADALVSRLDGTYAVQTSESPGAGRFVTVQVVAVSGGDVGVRGDGLEAGATVFVPV